MDWIVVIPFAIVLLMLIALLLTWRPVGAALGVYALLLPFDSVLIPAQIGGIHLHFTWFVGAAAAGVLLAHGALRSRFVTPPRSVVWLALLVGWASLSALWAIDTGRAVFRLPLLVLLLIIYLAAVASRVEKKDLETIGFLTLLGGCMAAMISLYRLYSGQWYVGQHAHYQLSGRASLWDTDPNHVAASLILPLCLAVGQLHSAHSWLKRLLLTGAIVVLGAGICSTMSRGALLAGTVALLIIFWRSGAGRRTLWIMFSLAALTLAMPAQFFSRIGGAVADRGAGRLDIWTVGLRTLKHYWLLGAGLDCFPNAYRQFVETGVYFVGLARAPHNIYLGTWVELGVVGFALLFIVIRQHLALASAAREAMPNRSLWMELVPYEAAFYGLLINGFFLDLQWETYFWLALVLLAVAAQSRAAAVKHAFVPVRQPYFGFAAWDAKPLPKTFQARQ